MKIPALWLLFGLPLLCGAAVVYLDLRRRRIDFFRASSVSFLIWFDIACTAAALDLGFWANAAGLIRSDTAAKHLGIALLLSGGGFVFLWTEGRQANQFQRPKRIALGEFLVLAAFAHLASRLLNSELPYSYISVDIGLLLVGGLTLFFVVSRFLKKREEHHIIERVSTVGETQQPEYTPPTEECPHPERWTMMDSMSAEVEVLDFLHHMVRTMKPNLIVETGTFIAASTIRMAEALRANGFGKIITCEFDPLVFAKAKERVQQAGLSDWIECRNQSSLDMEIAGHIDLFFSDSHLPIREDEIRRFLPQIGPNAIILMHDANSHYKVAREAAFRLEAEGLISMVLLPTPRGLMIAQKRSGRR